MFFFEKKNQKTFVLFRDRVLGVSPNPVNESLFASFSSEKEES
jgi:hypothetical protein